MHAARVWRPWAARGTHARMQGAATGSTQGRPARLQPCMHHHHHHSCLVRDPAAPRRPLLLPLLPRPAPLLHAAVRGQGAPRRRARRGTRGCHHAEPRGRACVPDQRPPAQRGAGQGAHACRARPGSQPALGLGRIGRCMLAPGGPMRLCGTVMAVPSGGCRAPSAGPPFPPPLTPLALRRSCVTAAWWWGPPLSSARRRSRPWRTQTVRGARQCGAW
jgi:hypothetical protein